MKSSAHAAHAAGTVSSDTCSSLLLYIKEDERLLATMMVMMMIGR